ncbi:MAG: ribokinase [Bacteroidota bacterium]
MITVIGSSNTDMILKLGRIPAPGETLLGGEFQMAAGGKGANQAVAAARAGAEVTFIACVGKDVFGEQAIQGFQKDGIHTQFVFQEEGPASGVALIFVSEQGENSIGVASGANAKLLPKNIDAAISAIEEADLVLLQLETPIETIAYAIEMAHKIGKKIILNPAPAQALSTDILSKVDILTPNETEAALLTGMAVNSAQDAEEAAKKLGEMGVKEVIITLGKEGALHYDGNSAKVIPGFVVDAQDTTAAGDTFNGSLSVGLTEGKSMEEAIRFAHGASALSVTRMGAQPSVPSRKEIEDFLAQQG